MKTRNRSGFTLIELVAVVLIILLLMGIMFRAGSSAGKKIKIAETAKRLEHLKLCIEEFYIKYGHYPPVPDEYGTECYWVNGEERFGCEDTYDSIAAAYAESGQSFNEQNDTLNAYLTTSGWQDEEMTDAEIGEYRDQTGWWSKWPGEDQGSTDETGEVWDQTHMSVGHFIFSNRQYYISDSWGGVFHYDGHDPSGYQSYRVWSNGPDGIEGTADDIGHDSFVK